jgi:sigma-B regulation protein RsbU (phosphoserine phosphatase)
MASRLFELRLWLDKNALLPRGKLAFLTLYLAALDLLLFLIRKLAGLVRGSYGQSLGGWTTFLTFVVLALAAVLVWRRLSARLLWRVRNRLIVTYVFIGLIPLVLLVSLAGLAFYLFAGQFATYIVTSKLDADLESLSATNRIIARELATALNTGHRPETFAAEQSTAWSDRELCFWLDDRLVYQSAPPGLVSPSPRLPGYLPTQFVRVVRDERRLFLRATSSMATGAGKLTVVSSRPLDQRLLLELATNLGEVTLYASGLTLRQKATNPASATSQSENPSRAVGGKSGQYELETGAGALRPTLTAGDVPEPTWGFDRRVSFPTAVYVANWLDGDTSEPAAIRVETRVSRLYDHLFSSLGYFAPAIEVFLAVAAALFIATEAIAWWIGTRLTRSVTGAVAQLYRATAHINRGDFSHRVPIRSRDQLAALAASFNLMTESIEKLILEQQQKQRLENEITIAQEVQAQLFPRHISQLPSLEVHGFCRPARSVSGDYYDFVGLGRERMALAVGDVSGKGISAALLMATIHSAVRAYSIEGIPALRQAQAVLAGNLAPADYGRRMPGAEVSPANLISLLNHQLYQSTPAEKYATLFLAMYDGSERRLHYSNAGHLPPLVLGERAGAIRRLQEGGTVVGLFEDVSYEEGSIQLRPGDLFLAYSDGVTEPENDFGEFGEERLIELVQENRDLPLARISELVTAAVDDWIGGAEQPDDVTLVLARAR